MLGGCSQRLGHAYCLDLMSGCLSTRDPSIPLSIPFLDAQNEDIRAPNVSFPQCLP
jgi:hypothetical protein